MSGDPRFEIALGDPEYPACLLEIERPPRRLYGRGDPGLLGGGLGVIGARKATPYGLAAADLFAGWAASIGVPIVSGAAIGCDQAAHRAALRASGPTVAVLGTGADVPYPAGARELIERIVAHGCVVSEQPWGFPPQRWAFRERNRIIAGLSEALLVVEAAIPSGTFSTADFALAAGRSVFVVPGSIFSPESRGCNRLLQQGATPVSEVADLAGQLGLDGSGAGSVCVESKDDVLRALLADPMRPDDLAHRLGLDIVTTAIRVGELELAGSIRKYPDGRYGPC